MALRDPVTLTQLIGFGVFLWLGVYLLTRVTVRTPTIVASIAGLFAQAAFFSSSALSYNTPDPVQLEILERAFWWTSVLPVATWFHFSFDAASRVPFARRRGKAPTGVPAPVIVVYLAAMLVIVFGTATDLFLGYSAPGDSLASFGPGSLYPLYPWYLGLVAGAAFVNLARGLWIASRSEDRGDRLLAIQLRLLTVGGLLFLIGALWISSRYSWGLTPRVLPGYACLLFGLAGLGYGVARFGLLLEGKNIQRDFSYSLLGIGLINLLYVVILKFYGRENAEERGETRFYERVHGSEAAKGDPFAIDLSESERLRGLYLEAEHEDGYFRDQSVFGNGISIEDDMAVLVRYQNGATMSYHLTAYSPREGLRVAFNGTKGRIDLEVEERPYVSGSKGDFNMPELRGTEPLPEETRPEIIYQPLWGKQAIVPIEQKAGGHGGGDVRLLEDLFAPERPDDPLHRAAGPLDGVRSILTGIAANRAMQTGQPVRVADLVRF